MDSNVSLNGQDPQSHLQKGSFHQDSFCGGSQPELSESVLNLLEIMSHDIRSSLLSMLATLKLLNRGYYGKMEDEVAGKIKELLSGITRLTGISEEYVERTFAMKDEFESESECFHPIQDVLNPVLEELSPELKNRRIEINRTPQSSLPANTLLRGNKIWLKTIFRNLIQNAIKHSAKGSTIAIGFEQRGSQCQLNVYNDGSPIPEQWRDKLFMKFGCIGDASEKEGSDEGMGLGLYLIKKIIERQGGEIWYEAKEHGSNFVFTLPTGDS